MQINRSNSAINFNGTIPIRFYIDGMETFSEKEIKNATRQLTSILAGPIRDDKQKLNIAKKLAAVDPDYNIRRALNGFKLPEKWKSCTPSDFFRVIKNRAGRLFLLTGYQGEHLAELGKTVGKERIAAKERNCTNSFDLMIAKKNYESFIENCLEKLKLRVTEGFDPTTKQRTGSRVELNIHMISNQKYGKSTFKMTLNDISFTKEK